MFLKSCLLFIYAETPLHAGTGSGLGPVDLPIQRERSTGYPIIQASSIKGALRSEAPSGDERTAVFGHEKADHAGALSPGDARLLLFPVRSLAGVFAWTTSYHVLERFRRDAVAAGMDKVKDPPPPLPATHPADNNALASGARVLLDVKGNAGTSVLEEFAFQVTVDSQTTAWAKWLAEQALPEKAEAPEYEPWVARLQDGLLVLPEEAFRDFLFHSTEVVTRVRLEPDSKTVASGALWTEEHLPTDTLLYAPVHATKLRINGTKPATLTASVPQEEAQKVLEWVKNKDKIPRRVQLGGGETVGRGMVYLRWNGGA